MDLKYKQFMEDFRECLLAVTGYTEDKIYMKIGENSVEEDRIFIECARKGDICQVCSLHTKELFDFYSNGTPMEDLVQSVVEGVHFLKKEIRFQKALNMDEYCEVQDELFIRLLNYERNKSDLQDAIYQKIGDIAMVLYMRIGQEEDCMTGLKVKKSLFRSWGLDEKQVFDRALINTYFMSPPRMYRWENMIFNPDYHGENFMNLCEDYQLRKNCMGNCLSTIGRTNGAVAIFLPGVAKRIAHLLGHDFYIVFTSIHEAMIHNDQMVDIATLRRILKETVQEATPEEDFLTYQIFHYECETGQFTFE